MTDLASRTEPPPAAGLTAPSRASKGLVLALQILAVLLFFALAYLLLFVVPKFRLIYQDMLGGRPLPAGTVMVLTASQVMQSYWFLLVTAAAVIGFWRERFSGWVRKPVPLALLCAGAILGGVAATTLLFMPLREVMVGMESDH